MLGLVNVQSEPYLDLIHTVNCVPVGIVFTTKDADAHVGVVVVGMIRA